MLIVTDRGTDLTPEQLQGLTIHYAPLFLTLEGKTYRSGEDITAEEFYRLIQESAELPTTSLPSPGDFAELYRKLAAQDPDILSIHISSGLSGTLNSAQRGAEMVPEARVTFYDTKTLSAAEGWHVEAAARAAQAGWPLERILTMLEQITRVTETIYTLPTLKYLIHGGRISHLKGLVASVLNIKPIIGVTKDTGMYYQRGQVRAFNQAVRKLADVVAETHKPGTPLRVQIMHTMNHEAVELLREAMEARFECHWLPTGVVAPVLGAHTGVGLVGIVYAALADYPELPPLPSAN